MDNPFVDGDAEWSDEEELIPKGKRKTQYVPPHIKITAARLSATETDESSSNEPSPNRLSVNGSPLLPPKSPSRPDVRPGSSQEDLVKRFYEVSRERDALRKQLHRKSMEPHSISTRTSVIYKSEEKSLIEALQALRYEIRVWSEEFFSGPLTSRTKHPRVKSAGSLFGSLTDNYNAYLKHYTDRPLLIQAYIWSVLQRKIFSTLDRGCGYIWAGKLGDRKLRPLNDVLRKGVTNEEQAEEYHHWRAMTVSLLVPQVDGRWRPVFDADPILKRISRFSSRLRRKLRPWASHSLRDGKEQLHTIVSAAVDLDLRLKRQRADYRFVAFVDSRPNQFWGFPFVDDEMEDIDDDNGRRRHVELSLAPALERCGNANGHVFDQSFILVKAEVTCKRLEKRRPMARKRGGNGIRRFWDR